MVLVDSQCSQSGRVYTTNENVEGVLEFERGRSSTFPASGKKIPDTMSTVLQV